MDTTKTIKVKEFHVVDIATGKTAHTFSRKKRAIEFAGQYNIFAGYECYAFVVKTFTRTKKVAS